MLASRDAFAPLRGVPLAFAGAFRFSLGGGRLQSLRLLRAAELGVSERGCVFLPPSGVRLALSLGPRGGVSSSHRLESRSFLRSLFFILRHGSGLVSRRRACSLDAPPRLGDGGFTRTPRLLRAVPRRDSLSVHRLLLLRSAGQRRGLAPRIVGGFFSDAVSLAFSRRGARAFHRGARA